MGLIKELVLLPVAPVRGVLWVSERIAEQVEQERYAPGAAVQRLEDLEAKRERGEVDEETAKQLEEQVIEEQLDRTAAPGEEVSEGG
ncbi:MAG: gas vesicle protein [Actinobacteria bacterium]|nr:MAG: gas vesicle protein [Actinomycetota bacterium]